MREGNDIGQQPALGVLTAVTLMAAVLRFIGGDDQLWYDEIRTLILSVRENLDVIVTHFPSNNDHVLYSVLSHIAITIGGETPLMIRFPAIIFGILSIPLIYTFGCLVTTRLEALAAAILAAVAAHHIWFSQNARGYTLLLVVTLLSTQLLLQGLKRRSLAPWLWFALVSALGAYTHLTMVIAVIGQAVAVGIHLTLTHRITVEDIKGPAVGFLSAAFLTVLLYLPMIGDVASFFGDPNTNPKAASAGWAVIELVQNLQFGLSTGVTILGGTIFIVGVASYFRQSWLLPLLFFIPAIMIYGTAILLHRPTFPRFFFFIAGFLLLVVVRGVFSINRSVLLRFDRRWLAFELPVQIAATVAMAAVLLADLSRTYLKPKMDYQGALSYVIGHDRPPGDKIVMLGEHGVKYPYTEYYGRNWPLLTSADQLLEWRKTQDIVVMHTFERYIRLHDAPLLDAVRSTCVEEKVFHGTLNDGDIHVSRCKRVP